MIGLCLSRRVLFFQKSSTRIESLYSVAQQLDFNQAPFPLLQIMRRGIGNRGIGNCSSAVWAANQPFFGRRIESGPKLNSQFSKTTDSSSASLVNGARMKRRRSSSNMDRLNGHKVFPTPPLSGRRGPRWISHQRFRWRLAFNRQGAGSGSRWTRPLSGPSTAELAV